MRKQQILEERKPLKLFIELHPFIMGKKKTMTLLKTLKKFNFKIKEIAKSRACVRIKHFGEAIAECSVKTIDGLLADDSIMGGEEGALEIFFERG